MTESKNDSIYDQPIQNHEYDGITELDNPLPMWWLWTFLGAIIFAFIYFVHYEFGGGDSSSAQLEQDLSKVSALRASAPKEQKSAGTLLAIMNDKSRVEAGKAIFDARCVACHGPQGGGTIGPNLTDKFWKNGKGKPEDLVSVVTNGVTATAMQKWEGQLKPDEIDSVVAFVYSIRGSNPPGAKVPEGPEIPDYY